MAKYKEIRRLTASALRSLCIEHDWYTCGDNDEYDHLLLDLAGNVPHLDTAGIIAIAEDIAAHSKLEDGEDVPAIAFEVARACSVTFRRVPEVAEGLPELCFSTLPSTGELICFKRGESGYYPSAWSTADPERNGELADFNNRKLGVTQAQRLAMEFGSMFGWDAAGADPEAYEQAPSVPEELAAAAKRIMDDDLPKLKAVLEATKSTEPNDIIEVARQIDQYILEPEHRSYKDIALSDLRAVAGEPALELLVPHVDLDAYGRAVAGNMNLVLTPYGTVSRRDCRPIRAAREDT